MTGIQTHTQVRSSHGIQNILQLLKAAAHLAALACHGFQQHRHRVVRGHGLFQGLRYVADSGLQSLPHMAAGMEIVEIPRQGGHPPQIILQNPGGKGPCLRVGGAQIHGIRPVGDQGSKTVLAQHPHSLFRVGGIFLPGLTAPGIPGEKREGVRPNGQRRLHHRRIPVGSGQVASIIPHVDLSFSCPLQKPEC